MKRLSCLLFALFSAFVVDAQYRLELGECKEHDLLKVVKPVSEFPSKQKRSNKIRELLYLFYDEAYLLAKASIQKKDEHTITLDI